MASHKHAPQTLFFLFGFSMLVGVSASDRNEESKPPRNQTWHVVAPQALTQNFYQVSDWDTEPFKVGIFWEAKDVTLGLNVQAGALGAGGWQESVFSRKSGEHGHFTVENAASQVTMAGKEWWATYVKGKECRQCVYMVEATLLAPYGPDGTGTTASTTLDNGYMAKMKRSLSGMYDSFSKKDQVTTAQEERFVDFKALAKVGNVSKAGQWHLKTVDMVFGEPAQMLFKVVVGDDKVDLLQVFS